MQDANFSSEHDPRHMSEDLSLTASGSDEPQALEPIRRYPPTEPLRNDPSLAERTTPAQKHDADAPQQMFLPQRGRYYAAIAGSVAGLLAALLTIVITMSNADTFHAVSLQIAADRLTVKTALALAAWELLTFALRVITGFVLGLIVGSITVRRRLSFLAGALAGAICDLLLFFVSLLSTYPGNLSVNGTTITTGSLVVSLLLFVLWSLGGGLVSLFATWIITVRHPHYVNISNSSRSRQPSF